MHNISTNFQEIYDISHFPSNYPLKLIQIGKVLPFSEYQMEMIPSADADNYYRLEYIIRGKGIMLAEDKKVSLKEGDLIFIRSEIPCKITSDSADPLATLFITVGGEFFEELLRVYEINSQYEGYPVNVSREMYDIFSLAEESYIYTTQLHDRLSLDLLQIIQKLGRAVSKYEKAIKSRDLAKDIMEWILKNLTRKFSISDLCRAFFLGKSQLIKIFKARYNDTPISFAQKKRIELADSYLCNTAVPISQIHTLVGFEDKKYLSRLFKRHMGVTLSQRRKQYSYPIAPDEITREESI